MAKDPIRSTLESFGMTPKEASVYLLLLQLGTVAASTLADRLDIPRPTAQFTCQQLVKRGLLRMVQKANAYLFTAEPPEKLELLLKKQQDELLQKEDRLHSIVGALKAMQNPYSVLPKVQFYEGPDGVVTGYRAAVDSVPEDGEILSYLHLLDEAEDEFGLVQKLQAVTDDMEKKRICNLVISPDSPSARAWQATDAPPLRVTRLLTTGQDLFPVEIMIYGDALYAVTMERHQIFSYSVRSKTIADMHRIAFLALWEALA